MDKAIELLWKDFEVPVEKLKQILSNIIGVNFDGIVCYPNSFFVVFKEEPNAQEIENVNSFWASATLAQFQPSLRETISNAINRASIFGRTLILDAAVENVEMGITQAGKTMIVADYCADIQRYLESGSLYAAIAKIDDLLEQGVPSELSPFITAERLQIYKAKIMEFLNS